MYFENPFVWVMLAALFLMPLVSFILRAVSVHFVKMQFSPPLEFARKEEEFDVYIDFYNRSILPVPSITAEVQIKILGQIEIKTATLSLGGKSQGRMIYRLKIPRCCLAEIKINRVFATSFSKGLHLRIKHPETVYSVPVIPGGAGEFTPIVPETGRDKLLQAVYALIAAKRSQSGEFTDLRLFADGDRESRIHWKLSAKSEELLVRDFSGTSVPRVLIVVDVIINPHTLVSFNDISLEDARRCAMLLSDEGIPCSFLLNDFDSLPRPADCERMIDRSLAQMIVKIFTEEKNLGISKNCDYSGFDEIIFI
jgi:uncharacterized protein (DUF58 family)